MHDIAALEEHGVPGVFVASAEFRTAADAQSRSLGIESPAFFVRHPIQDRTDDEMIEIADAASSALIGALVADGESP